MARFTDTQKNSGRTIDLAAPYDRTAGEAALIGAIFGVAKNTVLSGASCPWECEGTFSLAKTSAQAWTLGQKLYYDPATKLMTNVAGSLLYVGTAAEVAANPSGTGLVRLNGVAI